MNLPPHSPLRPHAGQVSGNLSEAALPRHVVVHALAAAGEACSTQRIAYYPSLTSMVEKACSSRNWAEGEVFVWADSPTKFVIFKQVAPDSCEMMAVTEAGYRDVFSAHRIGSEELIARLGGESPPLEALRRGLRRLAGCLTPADRRNLYADNVLQREAADVCQALRTVLYTWLDGEESKSLSAEDSRQQMIALSNLLAPAGSNGLGDTVVWPALRRAGRHKDAEFWTSASNEVRRARFELLKSEADDYGRGYAARGIERPGDASTESASEADAGAARPVPRN